MNPYETNSIIMGSIYKICLKNWIHGLDIKCCHLSVYSSPGLAKQQWCSLIVWVHQLVVLIVLIWWYISSLLAPGFDECGEGWVLNEDNNRCYFMDPNAAMNYDEARLECRLLGGELGSIHSLAENQFIHGKTHFSNISKTIIPWPMKC